MDEDVARVRVEQADDCLISTDLPVPDGPSTIEIWLSGSAEVEAVLDPGLAELLDDVDHLDRVLAAVVALLTRVPLVRVGLVRLDAGDRVVLVQVAEVGSGLLVTARRSRAAGSPAHLRSLQRLPRHLASSSVGCS